MSEKVQIKVSDSASEGADLILFKRKNEFIPRPFREKEFNGSSDSSILFHAAERREIYVGLGDPNRLTNDVYRRAAGTGIRRAIKADSNELLIDVSDIEEAAEAIAEGLLIGAYAFDDFLTDQKASGSIVVTLVAPKRSLKALRERVNRGLSLGRATNYVRQLGNLPGNIINPKSLSDDSEKLSKSGGLTFRTWSKNELIKEGFGGLIAVGSGSINDPRLIQIDYTCSKKKAPTIAVVGKAITFDSGGLCLKEAGQMIEMKFDKMGGCSVLGIMKAVAELRPDCNVVGLLAAAENMTGASAYRPGDIVTTYDGKTVEVANTDAEGRIVLADALGYVRKKIKPDLVVDLATLTGACVVALGEERAGLFCNDPELSSLFQKCGEDAGEKVWPLPFEEEFESLIESKVADVRNLGKTRWGGASTAATFLSQWTKGLPHIHLDIAGPAMSDGEKSYRGPGATGFGVRAVYQFIETWASAGGSKTEVL